MIATQRRAAVLDEINKSKGAISATSLAKLFHVSRQIIVGDIALLRAEGHDIIATARGYMSKDPHVEAYRKTIACKHSPDQTTTELYLLVDLGIVVEDVIIEHDVYGEMRGTLGLASRLDVDDFMDKLYQSQSKLLSELTDGIHLHTIICKDENHFELALKSLASAGFLLK